jgi:uncharacterized protein (DUF58 family)
VRRLEVSTAGKWYLVLTIAIGVVALLSGNNVLYLAESMLLAGLIVSGVLSERVINGIEIAWIPGEAIAGERSTDRIRLRNTRRSTLFCLEVGEWHGRKRHSLLFVPRLGPFEELTLRSEQVLPSRGKWKRDGFFIATSYPYGFARKLLLWREASERVVWPGPLDRHFDARKNDGTFQSRPKMGTPQMVEGELRAYNDGDPLTDVVWTASARGQGWWVRPRRNDQTALEVSVDLQAPDLENQIRKAAQPFLRGQLAFLQIKGESSATRLRIQDRVQALDRLATL